MAKTKTETAVAVIEETQTALATVPQDLLDAQGAGTENIKASDVRPPRLLVCQTTSPQKKNGPKKIAGIEEGDVFNSLTGEIYPRPLPFVVIQKLRSNGIQFDKQNVGKVIDYNVPMDDPRMQFGMENGRRTKPVATQFDNYLVLLTGTLEVVALSFKSTALKAARQLDSLIKYPLKIGSSLIASPPAWARSFVLDTTTQEGNGNTWATPTITSDGVTPVELRGLAMSLYSQYKQVQVTIEHDDEAATSDAPDDTDIAFLIGFKECFKCGRSKPLSHFYSHPQMGDGLLGKCRICTRKDARAVRAAKLEKYRAYDRERAKLPQRKANIQEQVAKEKRLHPDRQPIREKSKRLYPLSPLTCEDCGKSGKRLERHHWDYSSAEVTWLCKPCHWQADHKRRQMEKGFLSAVGS